jgi:hypothetical protein
MMDIATPPLPGAHHDRALEVAREACLRARDAVAESVLQRQSRQLAAGRRADDARRRSGLTVPELWLSVVSLGGNADLLDIDGFLAGVLPLAPDQQIVLSQALREQRLDLPPTGVPGRNR